MPSTKTKTAAGKSPDEVLAHYRGAHKGLPPLAPIDQLVIATLGVEEDWEAAYAALDRLRTAFVDWNEMRVARLTEIGRILDPLPEADTHARRVRELLNRLFTNRGNLELAFLGEMKPTDARRTLLDLDSDLPRNLVSMILFELCPGTTLPLGNEALAEAKRQGLLGRTGNKAQLQKILLASLTPPEAAELAQYFELSVLAPAPARKSSGGAKSKKKKTRGKATKKK